MPGDDTSSSVVDSPSYESHVVLISVAVGMIWTLLIFSIRVFVRFRIAGPFGSDDLAAGLGTVRMIDSRGYLLSFIFILKLSITDSY